MVGNGSFQTHSSPQKIKTNACLLTLLRCAKILDETNIVLNLSSVFVKSTKVYLSTVV